MDRSLRDLSMDDFEGPLAEKQLAVMQALALYGARHPERASIMVPLLTALLQQPDADLIALSTWALGQIGFEQPDAVAESIPSMVKLIQHPDSHVRQCALWALGRIAIARPDLIEQTLPSILTRDRDPDPGVRLCMLYACEGIAAQHPDWLSPAIPRLGRLLLDPDGERVQREALQLFRSLAAADPHRCHCIAPALDEHTRSQDADLREDAAAILSLVEAASSEA